MKKFCTNCGHEAPLSHKVCTNCGTPFPAQESEVTHSSMAAEPLPSRQKEKKQEKVRVKENKRKDLYGHSYSSDCYSLHSSAHTSS